MRSLKLLAAALALVLVAAACSDDSEDGEAAPDNGITTTTRAISTTTSQPLVTTPTSEPPAEEVTTTTAAPSDDVTETTTTPPPAVGVAPPPPPSNLECLGGTRENELLVEFDALPDPSAISKIRTYLQIDGDPVLTSGEYDIGQIDTTRDGGTRWAAPVRRVPANVPVKLYATSFNQLGQESGWYSVDGLYTAPGAPCGTAADIVLPPTTCTAGCDEEEGEPGA